MLEGQSLGEYQLIQSIHQTTEHTLWKARHKNYDFPILLRVTCLDEYCNIKPLEIDMALLESRKMFPQLPFLITKVYNANKQYLVQAKRFVSGQNLEKWRTSNQNKVKADRSSQDLSNRIGYLLQIMKRVRQIINLGFSICDLSQNNIIIEEDRIVILGCWYHLKVLENRNQFQLVSQCCHKSIHNANQNIRAFIIISISLIGTKSYNQTCQLLQDCIKETINNRDIRKFLKKTARKIRKNEIIQLQDIEIELNKFFNNIFFLKLPIIPQKQDQTQVKGFKGQRRFQVIRDNSKIVFKLGIDNQNEVISIAVDGHNSTRVYYKNEHLPLSIRLKFDTIKSFYDEICCHKNQLYIKDNFLYRQIQQQIQENIQFKEEKRQQNIHDKLNIKQQKVQVSNTMNKKSQKIILRKCQFYHIQKPLAKLSGYKKYEGKIETKNILIIQEKLQIMNLFKGHKQKDQKKDIQKYEFIGIQNLKKENYTKALQYLGIAMQICERWYTPNHPQTTSLNYHLALTHHHIQQHQQALLYCMFVLQAPQLQQPLLPLTLFIDILSNGLGDYEQASYYVQEGLKILSYADNIVAARFLNTAGVLMLQMESFQKAIQYLVSARNLFSKLGQKNEQWLMCSINLAGAYSLRQLQDGLNILNSTIQAVKTAKQQIRNEVQKILLRIAKLAQNTFQQQQVRVQIIKIAVNGNLLEYNQAFKILKSYCQA